MDRRPPRKAATRVDCPFCNTACHLPAHRATVPEESVRCGHCLRIFTLAYAGNRTRRARRWLRRLFRRTLLLALILVALGSAGWWVVDNQRWLRDHPAVRPHLESACERLGCALPPREGAPLFHVHQLRLIEDDDGNPLIDVILENRTGYRQPYPALRLIIEDAHGKRAMRQTFLTSDYLPAHIHEADRMPTHQPIRIHLRPGAGMIRTARITEGATYRLEVP